MTNSQLPCSADSTSERTGHCPLCWTYSKSDDYCSSFEEAIASTAERPMGCPWFTSEDRANWRARHKSSDGEPSNGKQPLMASRPAPPVPSDQTFHVAQSSQVTDALIEALNPFAMVAELDVGQDETDADIFQPMRSGYNRAPLITVGDMRRAAAALAAQPPAARVETKRKTFPIPPGHEAVRDSEGRATGEVRPRSSADSANDETGWLIEKDDPPVYCCLTEDYDEHWTPDASKALRFARREDAQAYSDHIGWTSPPVRVVEHMWPALKVMPRGGVEYNWHEWSVIYRRRLRKLMKLICNEGYAVSSDSDGMPYALTRDEPQEALNRERVLEWLNRNCVLYSIEWPKGPPLSRPKLLRDQEAGK